VVSAESAVLGAAVRSRPSANIELLSDTAFLWLSGEINIAARPQLSAVLGAAIAADPATIILDLNDVRTIDPDGNKGDAVLRATRRGIDLRIVSGFAFSGFSELAAGDADLASVPSTAVGADSRAREKCLLSPDDLLRVRVDEPTAGVLVVRPFGEIDLYTVAMFRDVVAAALQTAARLVVIDLNGVDFLGAKGMRAVIEAEERASSLGIPLRLAGGNGLMHRVLRICGDDAALVHWSTVEQALAGQESQWMDEPHAGRSSARTAVAGGAAEPPPGAEVRVSAPEAWGPSPGPTQT
jgi:anti-anti-sigma factor